MPMPKKCPEPRFYFHSGVTSNRNFEDRPELDSLCQWWRTGGHGVCALVGIGGSGKTALASRFLQLLPEVTEEISSLKKDISLATPAAIFSFSFTEFPDPLLFFGTLERWLNPDIASDSRQEPSFYRTMQLLGRVVGPLLLILDGMEAIQDIGNEEGARGRVTDPSMRDFLDRIANALLRGVNAIISTRLPIADLEEQEAVNYVRLEVESLPEAAAVDLLRRHGVQGNEENLLRIVREECGAHALTVDLMGAYIKEFGGTEVSRFSTVKKEELNVSLSREPSAQKRLVIKKELQFLALTDRYRSALLVRDSLSLWLLERVCMFRLPVPFEVLLAVFSEVPKSVVVTQAVSNWREEMHERLLSLCQLRLVQMAQDKYPHGYQVAPEKDDVYSVHLAVRSGFLRNVDTSDALLSHDKIGQYLQQNLSAVDHETLPTDPVMLDLLTEAMYHTVQAGKVEEAWHIHIEKVGGYSNLGRRLGAFARGERICHVFQVAESVGGIGIVEQLPEDAQMLWLYDRGRYLVGLGRLDDAMDVLSQHNARRAEQGNWLYASLGALQCCDLSISRGFLLDAAKFIDDAIAFAERTASAGFWRDCHAYRAQLRYLTGDTEKAAEDFAIGIPQEPRGLDYRLPIEWKALMLARSGEIAKAEQLLEAKHASLSSHQGGDRSIHPCVLALIDVAILKGGDYPVPTALSPTHEWAIANDAKETLCYASVLRSRYLLKQSEDKLSTSKEALSLVDIAVDQIEKGLRVARQCGYGLLNIDLLNCRAWAKLLSGNPQGAERDCRVALFGVTGWKPEIDRLDPNDESHKVEMRGIFPPLESGWPRLLSATHPSCNYLRGEAEAKRRWGDAILLQTAKALGRPTMGATDDVNVRSAKSRYVEAQELAIRLGDANEKKYAENSLAALHDGQLTRYPLIEVEEPGMISPDGVFVSDAHEDRRWLEDLKIYLAPFIRNDKIFLWNDTMIDAGALWKKEIDMALARAKVAVLLVTPRFLASEFIATNELPVILQAAKERGLSIIWIPVSASAYDAVALRDFQAAHPPGRPLDTLEPARRKQAFVKIASKIAEAIGR